MSENKLKTAVLGLSGKGRFLLETAAGIEYFQIQAVADKDAALAEKTANEYKCTAYDDYRQLIIQNQFDCLLVAAGTYSCDEYLRMAMKKKFNILKLAPLGRNFEEAAQFVRLAEEENIKFAVANTNRFAQSFLALRQFLQQDKGEQTAETPNATKSIWEPFLITAFCASGNQPFPAWQTDPKLAGGGVLLYDCYEIIDQIVWNFSAPQQVYSLNTNTTGDRQQRLYLTEDTAVVAMKFTDAFFVNLTASRILAPKQKFLKLYGKDKILTVSNTQLIINDHFKQTEEVFKYTDDASRCMVKLLNNFALSILSPDSNKLCSSGKENLRNMAVIESAYLSARTGFPEEPGRILEMPQVEPIIFGR